MLADALGRPPRDLRISVTDRCNFRCSYCMPLDEYEWIDRHEVLTFEEITRVATLLSSLGVRRIRITGGEPLLRKDLSKLVRQLARVEECEDLSLTTNGSLLLEQARSLRSAGLQRINVSLDTLDPVKFKKMTRRDDLDKVLAGLEEAKRCGLGPIKINTVLERGTNDDEIVELVEFARDQGFAIRFIEFMDVGNANGWKSERMIPKEEVLDRIGARYSLKEVGRDQGSSPSVDYQFADGAGDIGVIASVTEPFCSSCSRARLTADGKLVTCLFSSSGFDLKTPIRSGSTDEVLAKMIRSVWSARSDRYSEERLEALNSTGGYEPRSRKKIEMISLGG